jgi:hypothetical protein
MDNSSALIHSSILHGAAPFLNGGLSGMIATVCIQPTDMVKVRIQLEGKKNPTAKPPSPLAIARDVVSRGKFTDLYTGLSAALLRQAVYTTSRLGLFDTFQSYFQKRADEQGRSICFVERGVAGLLAGGLAAVVGNPADLALIRMQADSFLPADQRIGYRGVADTLRHITRNEGILALWAGAKPTVIRAMAMNFGQLAFFAESKAQIGKHLPEAPEVAQTLGAAAAAGFFGAVLGLPFDFIKTRLQEQRPGPDGKLAYRGFVDCAVKVVRAEGWMPFYRGYGMFYLRVAPQA